MLATAFRALVFAITAGVVVATPAADAVATGAHFRVTVHFDDARVAKAALETAEAAWPFATALMGEPKVDAAKLLEIHLYRGIADYQAAEAELSQGRFKTNLAFTSSATGAAHIALQPELSEMALANLGLTTMTRELIAHEAAHVVCYRGWPNAATLPDWLAEGIATWVCQEVMSKKKWVVSADDDPMLARPAVILAQLEAEKKLPALTLMFDGLSPDVDISQRYAMYTHAFRFLRGAAHEKALTKVIAAARSAGGGANHGAQVAAAAREVFGGADGLAALDRAFAEYVRAQTPRWDEIHRALSTQGDAWTQATFQSKNAIAWRTSAVGAEAYEVSGEVQIFEGNTRQMNVLLGRTPDGFVQVCLNAASGVTIFEYDKRRGDELAWKRLAGGEAPALQSKKGAGFRMRVSKSTVAVEIDGKPVCSADVGDHPMQGACGLGALAGSAGLWRKFSTKKL